MGGVRWLIRSRLRARRAALVVIGLVVALGATGTLVALGAADRTANAYSRYRERANVGDVTINPSLFSKDIDRVIRTLPGVESVTSAALFAAGDPDQPRPTDAESAAQSESVQVLGSPDGRYVDMDRPALREGRLPTGHNEVLVNVELADAEHIHIGDVLPLGFLSRRDQLTNQGATTGKPFAVDRMKVVGIATLSDEVLPDGVYFRYRIVVSRDVAARYDCLPNAPGPNATMQESIERFAPAGCGTSYRLYSLAIRGGDRGVSAALDAFSRRSAQLTARLPKVLQDQGFGYTLVGKTTARDERDRVERSIAPITAALWVLAAAAAAITVATLGLVLARESSRARNDQRAWWRLGLTTRQRTAVIVVPLLVAVGIGLALALLGAWLISPIAPFGTVRSIDPSPALELARSVWLGALALSVSFVIVTVLVALGSSRHAGARRARPSTSSIRRLVRVSKRPEVQEGVRAAYSTNRGAGLVVALAGSAVAVFLAALVFGTSLSALTSTPVSYGWPWDLAAVGNFGYGGFDIQKVAATLDHRADVRSWSALGFSSSIIVDHDPVPALIGYDKASDVDVTIVRGKLPAAADEVALGTRTAADFNVELGDKVNVSGYEVASRRATVTGIVVLPSLGPFQADRAAPGRGIFIPQAMLEKAMVPRSVTFIGIDLGPGVKNRAALRDLRDEMGPWDPTGYPVLRYSRPIRPPEIINARSVRVAPLLVGGLLVLAATIGLAVAIVISVRARRRELAVLRTLGFTGRQLRISVRVQALAMMLGGFVVGAPIGILIGRIAWRAFASELGVLTDPTIPIVWIVVTGIGGAVVAALAAAGPARVAAGTEPAVLLRAE
jgi:hypothetical protein